MKLAGELAARRRAGPDGRRVLPCGAVLGLRPLLHAERADPQVWGISQSEVALDDRPQRQDQSPHHAGIDYSSTNSFDRRLGPGGYLELLNNGPNLPLHGWHFEAHP